MYEWRRRTQARRATNLKRVYASAIWLLCLAASCSGDEGAGRGPEAGSPAAGGGSGAPASGDSGAGAGGSPGRGAAGNAAGRNAAGSGGAPSVPTGPLTNPAPGSKLFLGANFWNLGWEGRGNYFQSGVNFASTQNPWRPELLNDLAPYRVLRFMDWNLTNESKNAQADWSTRLAKTADQKDNVALEWQIDLCNRAKKDYWVTVPHEAKPEYWQKLAQLIHDTLDPSLRVYVEWSNEVWNGQFPQRAFAQQQGNALKLEGSDKAAAYYVYASVRMFEAFEGVFGKDSPRLVKVLAGQAAYEGPCQNHVKALANKTINPNGIKADAYAIAPYFKGGTVAALKAAIPEQASWIAANQKCASSAGLPLIAYEGGSDSYGDDSGMACKALQRDAGMAGVYTEFLNTLTASKLSGPFVHYTHSGDCWGLKQRTTDATANAPKYRAVMEWVAAHP
ncbi:MAG TPA: hypothetical protein VJR89_02045 [Polyangiales bacterium]|nr:hypothetical protein [Polyangiales bacterium]